MTALGLTGWVTFMLVLAANAAMAIAWDRAGHTGPPG